VDPRLDERALWNEKFRSGSHDSAEPDPFLVSAYREYVDPLLGAGKALDLAGGTGRHAIFLAERGWNVTLLDVSDVGLDRARGEAAKRGLSLESRNEDAAVASLGREQFDLILVFFFLQRELFPAIYSALKPSGLLIYKTYTVDHPRLSGGRGPQHPMHLLKTDELLQETLSFRAPDVGERNPYHHNAAEEGSTMQVLFYRETVAERGVAELVTRRNYQSSR
jgi:tellurite methyltransferase